MVYMQKRRANRCQSTDITLISHGLQNAVSLGQDITGERSATTQQSCRGSHALQGAGSIQMAVVKPVRKKEMKLEKVLAEIGFNTGCKIKSKKLSPIDTSILLRGV